MTPKMTPNGTNASFGLADSQSELPKARAMHAARPGQEADRPDRGHPMAGPASRCGLVRTGRPEQPFAGLKLGLDEADEFFGQASIDAHRRSRATPVVRSGVIRSASVGPGQDREPDPFVELGVPARERAGSPRRAAIVRGRPPA